MFENAIFPIALVNKLVSLSNHPRSTILKKFAEDIIETERSDLSTPLSKTKA